MHVWDVCTLNSYVHMCARDAWLCIQVMVHGGWWEGVKRGWRCGEGMEGVRGDGGCEEGWRV